MIQHTDTKYKECIEKCLACVDACNFCASSCLKEEHLHMMAKCIQLDMECAVICNAAAQLMSMNSGYAEAICRICADICDACAAECSKHENDHCQACAKACRECAAACRTMSK